MATIFMAVYGRRGLRELAEQNLSKAHYLAARLEKQGATVAFRAPFFNEFVVQPNGATPAEVNRRALEKKIIGGLDLGRFYPELKGSMLLCATEVNRRAEMDAFVEACCEGKS
jgi:glycine dehydrogenase subunit 1